MATNYVPTQHLFFSYWCLFLSPSTPGHVLHKLNLSKGSILAIPLKPTCYRNAIINDQSRYRGQGGELHLTLGDSVSILTTAQGRSAADAQDSRKIGERKRQCLQISVRKKSFILIMNEFRSVFCAREDMTYTASFKISECGALVKFALMRLISLYAAITFVSSGTIG